MRKRLWLSDNRCYCAATFLCFAVMNIGPARAQNEMSRTAAQLEQLVAPIALYPDALLSQILMASTYPLEVVAAARWVQANPGVTYTLQSTGTVLTETIFSWPGLGRYTFQSAVILDFPAIMGVTLLVAIVYVIVNLIVDELTANGFEVEPMGPRSVAIQAIPAGVTGNDAEKLLTEILDGIER